MILWDFFPTNFLLLVSISFASIHCRWIWSNFRSILYRTVVYYQRIHIHTYCTISSAQKTADDCDNVINECGNWNWSSFVFLFSSQTGPDYGQGMNPISRLAQIQQAKKEKEPEYLLLSERGMPRRREFIMQVNNGFVSCSPHFLTFLITCTLLQETSFPPGFLKF